MAPEFPHFENQDELVEWFENADLDHLGLDEALGVVVAGHVELSLVAPWTTSVNTSNASSARTAQGHLDLISVD